MSFLNGTETRKINGVKVEIKETDDFRTYTVPAAQDSHTLMQWKSGNDYVISGMVYGLEEYDQVRTAFPNLGFEWRQVGGRVEFDSRINNADNAVKAGEIRARLVQSMELV